MKKFIVFLVLFFMCDVVYAAHLDLVPISGVYSSQHNMSNGSYFSSNQKKYYMDGRIVYCVEPGAPIYTNDYSVSDMSFSNLSQSVIDKISLIGHFGYDYPGHNSDRYFMAAQELIWESVGNNEVHFTTGINSTGDMVNIDYEKNEIMSLVNRYYIKPSFDGELISGIYNDEFVLIDSNNVLSNYEVKSDNAYIDGNKLVINFNKLGSDSVLLSRKKYDDLSSAFYMDSSSQDFMFLRANDVQSVVYLESYIPKNRIVLDKKGLMLDGYDNDFIYSLRGLNDIHFGLYASNDIYEYGNLVYMKDELVDELITIDGKASSSILPNGDYYLKEISTIDGFVLDNNLYEIHFDNSEKEVFEYMVNLENERQKVFLSLSKTGEVFDGIVSDSGNYLNVPLSGIKFGLFNGSDIYNVDGNLIVSKDTLLSEFVTDGDGNINEELDIPLGTYYLKELETLKGYKLDHNIYEFSVSKGNSDDIKIMVTREPIVNELLKSRLVINKIDEFGNRLEGAKFKLFDNSDNLIYEGVTDSNGIININDLSYGRYYFYEASAPYGYVSDGRIYEVFVNTDDDLIEVSVLNNKMPITSDIYDIPKKFSMIGLGFGLLSLSFATIYEKCKKN